MTRSGASTGSACPVSGTISTRHDGAISADAVRGAWLAFTATTVSAYLVGLGALVVVMWRIRSAGPSPFAGTSALLAVLASLAAAYGVLRLSVLGTVAPSIGDVAAFQTSLTIAQVLDPVTLAAIALAGVALWRNSLARRTGLVVAGLSVLLIPLGIYKPPFVYGLLLLSIGVALLRRGRATDAGAQPGMSSMTYETRA